jgi:hypothetical protein
VTVEGGAVNGAAIPVPGAAPPPDLARVDPGGPPSSPPSEDRYDDAPDDTRDDGLGDRIRPYALTGGRTRSAVDLPLESLVERTPAGTAALETQTLEHRRILELCRGPLSIAEVSAHLGVHLGVARVLVGDMKVEGLLEVHRPRQSTGDRPDIKLLERVLDGLQAL